MFPQKRNIDSWIIILYLSLLLQHYIWVCLKIVYPIVPNGFHDHYPYEKMAISLGIYPTFSDKPI